MKLVVFLALFASNFIFSQECEMFSPFEVGKKLEYTDYNKNAKAQGKSIHEVIEIKESPNPEALIKVKVYDKNEEVLNSDYAVKCVDGAFYVDMIRFFDQQKLSEQQNFELQIEGDFLEFPQLMRPNDILDNGTIDIKVNNQGFTILTMTMTILNRKVAGIENLTTPAGTFECYKITFDYESKFGILNFKGKGIEWVAKGIGVVKSENYNKKDKLRSYYELTSLN